jgi:hypothetical protein
MASKKIPGARSISKRQKAYLTTLHLDDIGSGRADFKGADDLEPIEEILVILAQVFVKAATDALNNVHSIDTGALEGSISFDEIQYNGGVYSVEISVLDYYKFIDQGVKGLYSTPAGAQSSPYKFKNLGVSKAFKNQIRKWIIRHGLKANARPVTKENFKHAIGREQKAKPFSGKPTGDSIAYAVAKSIKKKGIKPTKFWEIAEEALLKALEEQSNDLAVNIFINELTKK